MPVEIRELVIKTQIHSAPESKEDAVSESQMEQLKKQLMDQCKKLINAKLNKNAFNR